VYELQDCHRIRPDECAESSVADRHSKRAIRRDLAKLWLAQTFRDMCIIGLTRAEMTEITETALKDWCDKPAALENNERRSKDE
jgi:hypothetical protein